MGVRRARFREQGATLTAPRRLLARCFFDAKYLKGSETHDPDRAIQSLRQSDVQKGSPIEHSDFDQGSEAIQKRALEEGLPYQTLITSLLHKYASGRLREA
jgi:hypothetical protein